MGEELAELYGVGTATLWDIKMSAEWNLKFVSFSAGEDGSSTGQIVRRAESGEVGDGVYRRFFCKNVHKTKHFLDQFFLKELRFSPGSNT